MLFLRKFTYRMCFCAKSGESVRRLSALLRILFHAALDHFGHSEGRHVVGILAGAEAGVEAQLLGQLMGDAGTAAAYDELVAQAFRPPAAR